MKRAIYELYENGPTWIFLYNIYNVSLHIYPYKKDVMDKEITLKSNLTYIDLDTWLHKVYENQNFFLKNQEKHFYICIYLY